MADNLFGYTGTQTLARTSPIQVNVKPDLRAANAMDSILQLASTSLTVAGNIKQERDKTSFLEAKNEVARVNEWYDKEISNTTDEYKHQELLGQYETALKSIEDGYDLNEDYKSALMTSNSERIGSQYKLIQPAVKKRQLEDIDRNLGDFFDVFGNTSNDKLATLMKDAQTAYLAIDPDKEAASNRTFTAVMHSKIKRLPTDKEQLKYLDLEGVKTDMYDLIKRFDGKLLGKEKEIEISTQLEQIKDVQTKVVNNYIADYMKSEKVNLKQFSNEIDRFSHVYSPLEIANFKQEKATLIDDLNLKRQLRAEAALEKREKVISKTITALYNDPKVSNEEFQQAVSAAIESGVYGKDMASANIIGTSLVNQRLDKTIKEQEAKNKETLTLLANDFVEQKAYYNQLDVMKNNGQITQIEYEALKAIRSGNYTNNQQQIADKADKKIKDDIEIILKDPRLSTEEKIKVIADKYPGSEEVKASIANQQMDIAQKTEDDRIQQEASKVVASIKSLTSYKDGMKPEEVENYFIRATKGLLSTEDKKFVSNYRAQYKVENDPLTQEKAIKTAIYNLDDSDKEGYKKGVTNILNKAMDYERFSAEAILEINKNYDVKGDVQKKFNIDASNPSNAIHAVQAFNALVAYDKNQTRSLLGDTLYSHLEALSTRVQVDPKEKKPMLPQDDVRKLADIKANPDLSKVDYTVFNKAVSENNALLPFKKMYEAGLLFGKSPDDLIEEITIKAEQQQPTKGISLVGYPKNITDDIVGVIKDIPSYLNKVNKDIIGVSYNSADNAFYYSTPYDTFSRKMVKVDSEGNKLPLSTLEDVYMYITGKQKEERQQKIAEGVARKESAAQTKNDQKVRYGIGDFTGNIEGKNSGGEALKRYSDKILSLNPVYDPKTDTYSFNKYGNRPDGTAKGTGWLGEIKTGNGDEVMTEKSIGVNINGKEILIPSIVPTLTKEEIDYLKTHDMPNKAIIQKAVDHANKQIKEGKSPFKN